MVILSLGSNLGDRLNNLRQALLLIKQIPHTVVETISPVYISDALLSEEADENWDKPYLNAALYCETSLSPLALLQNLKNIELRIGRKPEKRHWGPREIDIDILAWDNLSINNETICIPHEGLLERPFALWPLADIAPLWIHPNQEKTAAQLVEKWGSRFTGEAPLHTKQIFQRIDMSQLVGVVNITPNSFSDGGKYLECEKALQHIHHLVESGADIIDIGAESTSPVAKPVDSEKEWSLLESILLALKKTHFLLPPKISIDTRHADVAKKAIAMGVDWINDVSGLDDVSMREMLISSPVECVMMHHRSIPENRQDVMPRHLNPIQAILEWGKTRLHTLEQLGIPRDKIIFDPGIGFGKMAEQSLLILKHIEIFKQLNTRILVGHSRKTFMSSFSNYPFAERDIETTTISLYLAAKSIDFLRIHNVEMCARGLKVMSAL